MRLKERPRVSGTGSSRVQIVTCVFYVQDEEAKTPSKKKKKKQEENGSEVSKYSYFCIFFLWSVIRTSCTTIRLVMW